MFKSYLKLGWRSILRHKGYTLLNITGLAVGLACGYIALLYITHQLGYDSCHENRDRIYRVLTDDRSFDFLFGMTPFELAPVIEERCPEIERTVRIIHEPATIRHEGNTDRMLLTCTTPAIFNIFTLPVAAGNVSGFGADPGDIILVERAATRLFGEEDPIGKTLEVEINGERHLHTVLAVLHNLPEKATLHLQVIVPLEIGKQGIITRYGPQGNEVLNNWRYQLVQTFLVISPNGSIGPLEEKLHRLATTHIPEDAKQSFKLQPMKDFYLHSSGIANNGLTQGNVSNLYLFGIVGGLILFLATANYVILSTARSFSRYKEVGLRKVIGAGRYHLIAQLLCDSILITLLAVPLAFLFIELTLPWLNEFLHNQLVIDLANDWTFLGSIIALTIIVGMAAGSYLAIYLSSLKPVDILRQRGGPSGGRYVLRRGLVTAQILIFVALIGCTGVIYKQLDYVLTSNLGFDKSQLVSATIYSKDTAEKYGGLEQTLEAHPGIIAVSGASTLPPSDSKSIIKVSVAGDPTTQIKIETILAEKDLVATMGLELVSGRDYSEELDPPGSPVALLNETAARKLGIDNPEGNTISGYRIIGIIKDFHIHSFREEIGPLMISIRSGYIHHVLARISTEDIPGTLEYLNKTWKDFFPNSEDEFTFFDDTLETLYQREMKIAQIIGFAALLAVFIACLGLIGLSSLTAAQRTKEIGIRKVLGASVGQVVTLLVKEFLILALAAGLLAWPVVYIVMNRWLENFAYRTGIDAGIPIIAATLGICVAAVTVCYQAVRAALANPVDAIKYE